jgi:hypothetical protein
VCIKLNEKKLLVEKRKKKKKTYKKGFKAKATGGTYPFGEVRRHALFATSMDPDLYFFLFIFYFTRTLVGIPTSLGGGKKKKKKKKSVRKLNETANRWFGRTPRLRGEVSGGGLQSAGRKK